MPLLSHAQNFEDVMLARAFSGLERGFYVDVGAWDPEIDSVTCHFYGSGWSGINIEPTRRYFEKLVDRRPRDVNLNVAIGSTPGAARMFEFSDTGLSTLSPELADAQKARGFACTDTEVPIRPLADVLAEHAPQDIHFLKIDCEGGETDVIRSADFERVRPWVVLVEAVHPATHQPSHHEWEPLLLEASYDFAYFDGLNRFYVASERPALRGAFDAPPNVFDDFVRAADYRRWQDAAASVAGISTKLAEVATDIEQLAQKLQNIR